MKLSKTKLKTYGRIKDRSPMVKVLLFISILAIFTFFLTIARSSILDNPQQPTITGAAVQNTQVKTTPPQKLSPELNAKVLALSSNELVQDLPKKSILALRIEGSSYTITKGSITVGNPKDPDLTIYLPGKYAQELSGSLCDAIKSANNNRDLNIKQYLSQTKLAWKYKSMLKYKDCLGI